MSFYSQKSYTSKLGTCTQTIAQAGCAITTACNLFPRIVEFSMNPSELNKYCTKNVIYSNGCMLNMATLASKFGMTYEKTTKKQKVTCMAETDHWKSAGAPQHFFMLKPDGTIIDPLDKVPNWKKNPYNIVSYRVFTKIPIKIAPELPKVTETTPITTEPLKTQPESILIVSEPVVLQSNDEKPVIQLTQPEITPVKDLAAIFVDLFKAIINFISKLWKK